MSIADVISEYARSKGKEVIVDLSSLPKTRGNFADEFKEMYRAVEFAGPRGSDWYYWLPFGFHLMYEVIGQIYRHIPMDCKALEDILKVDGKTLLSARRMEGVYAANGTSEYRKDMALVHLTNQIHFSVEAFVQHYFWDILKTQMLKSYEAARKESKPLEAFEKAMEPLALLIQSATAGKIYAHPIYAGFMDFLEWRASEMNKPGPRSRYKSPVKI